MRKFVLNLFVFLMITLLFNIVVFVFANDNYYKGYKDFPSKNFHSYIIADSHGMSLDHYTEKYKVYNFSSSSDSYLDMKRKIGYLIDNKYQVDTIYLTVDGHTLSPYRDQHNNADKSIIYTSEVNGNYLKEKYLKYYLPIFQLKVNPLFRIYLESKVAKIFPQKKGSLNNLAWSELPEKAKEKRASERANGQFPTNDRSADLEKTLLEIISLCKTNNIELVGVKFPLSKSFIQSLQDRNYKADEIFISKGLKVIDHESLFITKDEYFKDEDHLTFEGGEEFAKILWAK